jgi:hypothetical protein
MKRSIVSLIAIALALAAAGCSSGGSGSSPVSAPVAVPTASSNGTKTTLTLVIAPASTAKAKPRAKRPQYVSPSTQGGAFYVWAAGSAQPPTPTAVADLSSTSTNCTANSDGSRSCSVAVNAPGGNDTIKVILYDQKPSNGAVSGNALATGSVQASITANQQNTVPITLNGIPATATITFAPSYLSKGVSGSSTGTVVAEDADGNVISGTYSTSITIVNGDTTGSTTFTPSIIPDSSTTTAFAYNGSASFTNANETLTLELGTTSLGTGSIAIVPPSKIGLSPTSLSFLGVGSTLTSTVAVSEANFTGSFTASTTNCSGIASLTSNSSSTTSFTFSPTGVGTCSYSISDGVATATLPISVKLSAITASPTQLAFTSLGSAYPQSVTVSEKNYTGNFTYDTNDSSCYQDIYSGSGGYLTPYPTVSGSQDNVFSFYALVVGQCTVIIDDQNSPVQSVTLNVSITNTTIGGQ